MVLTVMALSLHLLPDIKIFCNAGNYSCFAENELGKSRGFIELSGGRIGSVIMLFNSSLIH